jgi:cystathionine beta-lyase family protein involved in aluminum resistance
MQDLYYYLQEFYDIDTDLCKLARDAEEKAKAEFDRIEATAKINQARILSAFRQVGVAPKERTDRMVLSDIFVAASLVVTSI